MRGSVRLRHKIRQYPVRIYDVADWFTVPAVFRATASQRKAGNAIERCVWPPRAIERDATVSGAWNRTPCAKARLLCLWVN